MRPPGPEQQMAQKGPRLLLDPISGMAQHGSPHAGPVGNRPVFLDVCTDDRHIDGSGRWLALLKKGLLFI